jgi:hypothetical protein
MNIVLNLSTFNPENIFFLDKKKNNIIDGCFSKVIYSSEYFTMNGIFFIIHFINKMPDIFLPNTHINYNENKYTIYFYTHDIKNLQYITLLSELETAIINIYKQINGLRKRNNLVLTNQLYKGFFKIYKEKQTGSLETKNYMLKISGVWENAEEVGITYKFIEVSDI